MRRFILQRYPLLLAVLILATLALAAPPARGANADDLLEPEKAFRFSANAIDAATIEVRYAIADGYYLYRDRFKFAVDPAGAGLGKPQFPPGEIHEDAFFGKTEIYRKEVRVRLSLDAASPGDRIKLLATSQGCADAGLCYTPQMQSADIRLMAASAGDVLPGRSDASAPGATFPAASVAGTNDEDRFTSVLESGRLWVIMAVFFGAGLLLTFTPCVLPMIPILSGLIAGEGRSLTKGHAFALSLCYVLGMAVTYTAIGVGAALSGSLLSAALQNPWVLSAFAFIFVLLALSMFGFYELQLPSGVHTRLTEASSRLKGGHWGAVALMGVLSAAIVSPCVAAPLAGALLYISQTRDTVLGGAALFSMAIGMGVPLVAVGVSEGALLPRSGHWMRAVKKIFGVLLLAVAVWIVSPVLPIAVQMLAWAALLVGSAVFLGALDPLPHDASGWARLWKAAGIIALIAGAAQLVGAFSGSRDPLQPLSGILARSAREASTTRFERVITLAELDSRVASAGRPVMLDFYADWCVSCKEMESFTFNDRQVQARLAGMLLLQADVTRNTEEDKALLKRFRLFGPPGIVFFDRAGREIDGLRVIGYQPAEKFVKVLDLAAGS